MSQLLLVVRGSGVPLRLSHYMMGLPFPALRIHVSQSTINILERTDSAFEYEQRGETYLKV